MSIAFKRLTDIKQSDLIALMNHPMVRQHMPLLKGNFNEAACDAFIANKELVWAQHGYGIWAFMVDGVFAGWGGLQPENGDVDLALVLHPTFWGMGNLFYKEIIRNAFNDISLPSVTVLFPPTRTRIHGLLKLGFETDGELTIANERFIRYRLQNYRT